QISAGLIRSALAGAAPVVRNSAAILVMKKRVIVVSGLFLAVFVRRILRWPQKAISRILVFPWLLPNRHCRLERSAIACSTVQTTLSGIRQARAGSNSG